jgi:hypothetical protein
MFPAMLSCPIQRCSTVIAATQDQEILQTPSKTFHSTDGGGTTISPFLLRVVSMLRFLPMGILIPRLLVEGIGLAVSLEGVLSAVMSQILVMYQAT